MYEEANKAVTERPEAVFMGDSITEGWAREDSLQRMLLMECIRTWVVTS
ncbi:MAG: hypothetical protein IJ394_00370 [Bacteroidales bacterium]|nr:hypothetical protein [Bacteroidales bacterium]